MILKGETIEKIRKKYQCLFDLVFGRAYGGDVLQGARQRSENCD